MNQMVLILGSSRNIGMVLKQDVLQVVNDFQSNSSIPKGCNSSFISLIPKKDNRIGLN